jgi:hypothetical protein
MRYYRSNKMSAVGDFVASVSGSGNDFDITLDDGTVLEEYDPDSTSLLFGDDPAAGGLLLFGLRTSSRAQTVANADFIPATVAAALFNPLDQT